MRPVCEQCKTRPKAINYYKNDIVFYRTLCTKCLDSKKIAASKSNKLLAASGYKKKMECDRCGFHAKYINQLNIVFLDSNKLNVDRSNLRTYCANCIAELQSIPSNKRNSIPPDY